MVIRLLIFNRWTLPFINNLLTTEKQRKSYAYHEAGHAIAAITLDYGKKLKTITIAPSMKNTLGRAHYTHGHAAYENKETHIDIAQAKNWMVCELSGEAAENILNNTPYKKRKSAAHDHRIVKKIAQEILRTESGQTQQELIKDAQAQARNLMQDNQNQLEKIANALLEKTTLNRDEIYKISGLNPKQPLAASEL